MQKSAVLLLQRLPNTPCIFFFFFAPQRANHSRYQKLVAKGNNEEQFLPQRSVFQLPLSVGNNKCLMIVICVSVLKQCLLLCWIKAYLHLIPEKTGRIKLIVHRIMITKVLCQHCNIFSGFLRTQSHIHFGFLTERTYYWTISNQQNSSRTTFACCVTCRFS